jgi:hypothetical protein
MNSVLVVRGVLAASVVLCLGAAFAMVSCSDSNPDGPAKDTTPPAVLSVSPVPDAELVPTDVSITATFSEDIDSANVSSEAVTLTPDLPVTVSYADRVLTISPDQPLDSNTLYHVTILPQLRDKAGNAMATEYSWEFTTSTIVLLSPRDQAVVGDSVVIEVASSGSGVIYRVEFFPDPGRAGVIDSVAPFSYLIENPAWELGSANRLAATAYDSLGAVVFSDTVTVHYLWRLVIVDAAFESDGIGIIPRDLKNIYMRSTDSLLEFRVETNEPWPGSYKNTSTGISVAMFLDTDQNSATGQTTAGGGTQAINDIGAEYRIVIGLNGDSLSQWKLSGDAATWVGLARITGVVAADNSDFFECSINLSRLPAVSAFDLVVAGVATPLVQPYRWDWAPNPGGGHASCEIDKSYRPSTVADPTPSARPESSQPARNANPFSNPFD